jgi:hypothetical protein
LIGETFEDSELKNLKKPIEEVKKAMSRLRLRRNVDDRFRRGMSQMRLKKAISQLRLKKCFWYDGRCIDLKSM